MAYSTAAMVRQALVPSEDGSQPATPSHTAADLSDTEIEDAIGQADATIDGYLSKFYLTPASQGGSISPTPHPIDYWSRDIAAYNATLTYRQSQDMGDSDPVVRRFENAMRQLRELGNGHIKLDLDADTGPGSAVAVGAAYGPYQGTLFPVEDFDVNGPLRPGFGGWDGPFWRSW